MHNLIMIAFVNYILKKGIGYEQLFLSFKFTKFGKC